RHARDLEAAIHHRGVHRRIAFKNQRRLLREVRKRGRLVIPYRWRGAGAGRESAHCTDRGAGEKAAAADGCLENVLSGHDLLSVGASVRRTTSHEDSVAGLSRDMVNQFQTSLA